MALTPAWPGVNGLATTTDARKDLAGLIVKDASGVARSGIFPAHTNPLISARADMNIDIAAFTGAAVQFGGPILLCNDGVAQLPSVLVSPGSGTNYYVIYAKQNESTAPGTDANNNRVFGAQLSTTSLAVARAAMPAGALELGTVEMPTGKTATNQGGVVITPTYRFTATEGGVVLLRNSTEQGSWTPHDGSLAYRIDTGQLMIYLATATTPGWYVAAGEPTFSDLSYVGIYSEGGIAARVVEQAGRVSLEGVVVSTSALFVAGTTYTLGSIPSGLAPSATRTFACSANATAVAAVTVSSSGTITFTLNTGFTGPLSLSLAGASWPAKGL